jgi:hypothetical protein
MSFRSLLIAAVAGALAAACSFDPSGLGPDPNAPDAQRSPDGSVDGSSRDGAPVDAAVPPDAGCLADVLEMDPSNFDRCDIPNPPGPGIVLSEGFWFLDTDDGTLELYNSSDDPEELVFTVIPQVGGPEILLVAVEDLEVREGAALIGVGSRALAIFSYDDIDIHGVLSVGAVYQFPGAGSNAGDTCAAGAGAEGSTQSYGTSEGGSGGGGGAYGGDGGDGSIVAGSLDTDPTPGGVANGDASLTPLRGGCPGGHGGERNPLLEGSLGGEGGGALQLVAADTLTIGGYVTASGGGGRGATVNQAGGGGGGSGGGSLLEALVIEIEGGVTA